MPDAEIRSPNRVLAERIQFIACAVLGLFVAGWIAWFSPYDDLLDRSGTPLGADFAMFYVAGQVVAEGAGDRLYEQAEHQQQLQRLFPGLDSTFVLPYRYPPFVAVVMAPLSVLPYPMAYALFLSASCGAWWVAARRLVALCPAVALSWNRSLRWMMFGWPVALETIIGGQASMFALGIAVGSYGLLRNHQFVWAGTLLALAAYKPNVLGFVAFGCLIRYPRVLLGFVPMGLGLGLVCLVPDGWRGVLSYWEMTTNLATQSWDVATPLWKVHGAASWFELLLGDHGRSACILLGLMTTTLLVLGSRVPGRRHELEPLWFALLILVNTVFNPYTPIYDLVLLLLVAVLTAEHLVRRHGPNVAHTLAASQLLLAIMYFGPHLSQMLAKLTGAQAFPLVLVALGIWLARMWWQARPYSSPAVDRLLTSVSG